MKCITHKLREAQQAFFPLLIFVVLLMNAGRTTSQSTEPRAATILITYDTVMLQRDETVRPLRLRRDAVAIVGVGDTIITNSRGRALVRFEDSLDVLIMPDTSLEILELALDRAVPMIHLRVVGNIIVDEPEGIPTPVLTIETERLTITPLGTIGIWANYDNSDAVTVVESGTRYTTRVGTGGRLGAGEGLLTDSIDISVIPLGQRAPFLHAAQLIANLRGCPARVVRTGGQALNVRVAPGLGNIPIGYVEENAPVAIMGMIPSGSWYRVQRFSGFGWMRSIYLAGDCTDLRTYPNTSVERNLDLLDLQPAEYELIQPFFGTPDTNPWVYRTFRASPYDEE